MTRRLLPCAFVAFVAAFGTACEDFPHLLPGPDDLPGNSNAVLVLTGLDDDELLITLRIPTAATPEARVRELSLNRDDAREDDDTVVNVYYQLPDGTHNGTIEVREVEDDEIDDTGKCGAFQFVVAADIDRDTEAVDVDRLEDCAGDDDDDIIDDDDIGDDDP